MSMKIVIVEDSMFEANALKKALETQTQIECSVCILNPNRKTMPSFEAFYDEILQAQGNEGIVLLDNSLGGWRWKGANLAPSLANFISISSEEQPWASHQFTKKAWVAQGDTVAISELLNLVTEVAESLTFSCF